MSSFPLNQILYGPPGTGKTFITRAYALAIATGRGIQNFKTDDKEKQREFVKQYRELEKEGRIRFCTFHQSMSYEDFVEGIKPSTENDEITYEVVKGHLREIVEKSKSAKSTNLIDKIGEKRDLTNEEIKSIANNVDPEAFLDEIKEDKIIQEIFDLAVKLFFKEFYYSETIWPTLKGKRESKSFEIQQNEKTALLLNDSQDALEDLNSKSLSIGNTYGVKQPITLYKLKNVFESVKLTKSLEPHYYAAIYLGAFIWAWFKEIYKGKDFNLIHSDQENAENYILIIDEINRGNIAAIFGELITLLEESKRLTKPDETWVTLTYSKEQFCLPPNLYIIGTMNTADRSVEALDTALRRRFSFIEMPPRPNLLKNNIEGINLQALLTALNQRITALKDADHTIGHAWFMGCDTKKDVLTVMVDKVIPLLREHFYNENEKLEAVIGDQFFESATPKVDFLMPVNGNKEGYLTKRLFSREQLINYVNIDLTKLY